MHSLHLVDLPARLSVGMLVRPPNQSTVEGLQHAMCLVLSNTSVIVNVFGSFELHRRARLVARATNLFNARYQTFGLLDEADEVLGNAARHQKSRQRLVEGSRLVPATLPVMHSITVARDRRLPRFSDILERTRGWS